MKKSNLVLSFFPLAFHENLFKNLLNNPGYTHFLFRCVGLQIFCLYAEVLDTKQKLFSFDKKVSTITSLFTHSQLSVDIILDN